MWTQWIGFVLMQSYTYVNYVDGVGRILLIQYPFQ